MKVKFDVQNAGDGMISNENGWQVTGQERLIPVKDIEEGKEILKKRIKDRTSKKEKGE